MIVWNRELDNKIIELRRSGMSYARMEQPTGFSQDTLRKRLKQLAGLDPALRPLLAAAVGERITRVQSRPQGPRPTNGATPS